MQGNGLSRTILAWLHRWVIPRPMIHLSSLVDELAFRLFRDEAALEHEGLLSSHQVAGTGR